jgi:hypothetical protein
MSTPVAGEAHESVGDGGENQQATEQREKEIQVHETIRRARVGEIAAEIGSRSK